MRYPKRPVERLALPLLVAASLLTTACGDVARGLEDTDDRDEEGTATARSEPDNELGAELETNERETFAGLWIEHEPEYRGVASFTKDGEETLRPYVEGGTLEAVIEVEAAGATLAELEAAQAEVGRIVRSIDTQADSGIDVRNNRVELEVTDRVLLESAIQRANARLPEHVTNVQVEGLAQPM